MTGKNDLTTSFSKRRPPFYFTSNASDRISMVKLISVALLIACCSAKTCFALTIAPARDPRFNSSINPKFNSSINPTFNSSINPKFNPTINPQFNPTISPSLNSSINPKFNSSINPNFNSSLNPRYNISLDPTKSSWSGLYIFSTDAMLIGIAVRTDRGLLLDFGLDGEWKGYFASNGSSGYNWFTVDGEWIGYLVSNSEAGLNLFTTGSEWIGFLN